MEDWQLMVNIVILGFSVVIVTFIFLYFLLKLMGRVLSTESRKKDLIPYSDAVSLTEKVIQPDGMDASVVAAISAAIHAYSLGTGFNYIIKSVKPVQAGSAVSKWSYEGRKELLNMQNQFEQVRREKIGNKTF